MEIAIRLATPNSIDANHWLILRGAVKSKAAVSSGLKNATQDPAQTCSSSMPPTRSTPAVDTRAIVRYRAGKRSWTRRWRCKWAAAA